VRVGRLPAGEEHDVLRAHRAAFLDQQRRELLAARRRAPRQERPVSFVRGARRRHVQDGAAADRPLPARFAHHESIEHVEHQWVRRPHARERLVEEPIFASTSAAPA
jgi:hypothetical protein